MAQSIVLEGVCFSDKKSEYCADDRRTDVAVNEGGGLLVAVSIRFQHRLRRRATREWLGWAGSRGGPESVSTPLGIAILLTPSLLLGSSFRADRQR